MNRTILVEPRLPRAGLGNMLLVWARAVLFAEINSLPVLAPNWNHVRIGPWLRGERYKRYYGNFFIDKSYISSAKNIFYRLGKPVYIYYNLPLKELNLSGWELERSGHHAVVFDKMPHWSDYFQDLKEDQPFIKRQLLSMIRPSLLNKIYDRPAPEIGIHIRLSDFREATSTEDFAQYKFARTPIHWFIGVLEAIREAVGETIAATVFTDGYEHEVADLLKLPQVSLSSSESALSDLLTLSRSKLLIASSHSTFSAWAAYLGQCPTIWHPAKADHYQTVFSHTVRERTYEGGFDPEITIMPDLLLDNVKHLFKQ